MPATVIITPEVLRELIRYDSSTGELHWLERDGKYFLNPSVYPLERRVRRWNRTWAGKPALSYLNPNGYLQGTILKQVFLAHRVAWAIRSGSWPNGDIDHINGIRTDNRMENIRVVSRLENSRNQKICALNTSGVTGVSPIPSGKWRATISQGGKYIHLGVFATVGEAEEARKSAEKKYGYHPNHGRRA